MEGRFYRRKLPTTCISYESDVGVKMFSRALAAGTMRVHFRIMAQFRTQDEPAFCGVSSLTMVLNALSVDPQRAWKGVWRWYSESMLDCCVPIEQVRRSGITVDEFCCLAKCNGLRAFLLRPPPPGKVSDNFPEASSLEAFRRTVRDICRQDARILVVSYSRRGLDQTGDGHFSPIGGYDEETDSCLILDVARFKYPPHWTSVERLYDAMRFADKSTGLPRGWIVLERQDAKERKGRESLLFCAVHSGRTLYEEGQRAVASSAPGAFVTFAKQNADMISTLMAMKKFVETGRLNERRGVLREIEETEMFKMLSATSLAERDALHVIPANADVPARSIYLTHVATMLFVALCPDAIVDLPGLSKEVAAIRNQMKIVLETACPKTSSSDDVIDASTKTSRKRCCESASLT